MSKVLKCNECDQFYDGWCHKHKRWCFIAMNICANQKVRKRNNAKAKFYEFKGQRFKHRKEMQAELGMNDYKFYHLLKLGTIRKEY